MTGAMASASGKFEISNVMFKSGGLSCAAGLYLPNEHIETFPCIVMANGFSGTMDWILPDFAERFVEAGIAVFVFDYRFLGASEGEPRQLINLNKQRQDLRNALTWVRRHEKIDRTRIALWGTSLGGSHIIDVASTDPGIAVLIGNMPGIDAFSGGNVKAKAKAANASSWDVIQTSIRLLASAMLDVMKNMLGLQPHYLQVYGHAGKAIFTDPSQAERFEKLAKGSASWRNEVTARTLFGLPRYKDGTIARIHVPIFIALASHDVELNNDFVKKKFSESKQVIIKDYPYDHFAMYHEEAFEHVVNDQVDFLKKHLT